jgi:hypothetical protein
MSNKKDAVYSLTSEDLSNLGGPMGCEHTSTNFIKYFKDVEKAKKYAFKDYMKTIINRRYRDGSDRSSSSDDPQDEKSEKIRALENKMEIEKAKKEFKWRRDGSGWTTGDLNFVMYDIQKLMVK